LTTIAILQVPKGESLEISTPNHVDRTIVVHQTLNGLIDKSSNDVHHSMNERGDSPCGRWNHAIDLLILNRFDWEINIEEVEILLQDWKSPIRLIRVLEAGGYDEALTSFYNEDMLIRLKEIGQDITPRNQTLATILQDGQGDPTRFAMKHQFRLNQREWDIISNHISAVKPCHPMEDEVIGTSPGADQVQREFTIGVTLGNRELATRFLHSFNRMITYSSWSTRLVICLHEMPLTEVEWIIEEAGLNQVEIIIHDDDWGHEHGTNGKLGPWFLEEDARSGVSWGRCVLHHALWLATRLDENPLIWILDADIVLEPDHLHQVAQVARHMESKDCIVGIGQVLGDSPLMPIYTMRTQLIDYRHAQLAKQHPSRNRISVQNHPFHDMHHDLSTERMDHLEFPMGFDNAVQTNLDIHAIMSGKSATRLVHNEWRSRSEIPVRGGNTVLLSSDPLYKWPNVAPTCGGIQFRRGDTLWTLWIALEEPDSICSIPLVVFQIRLIARDPIHSISSIRGDIAGSMLTRAIRGVESMAHLSTSFIAESVIIGSKLREARLISNLIRATTLMKLIGIEQNIILRIERLASMFIEHDWPESIRDELESFLAKLNDSIRIFNQAHQSGRDY